MESFLSRYKNALVLILLLLAQVIGVAIQVRRPLPKAHAQPDAGGVRLIRYWAISLVSPPERLVHWMGAGILGVWDNYLDLIHVRQHNKDLQAELQRMRIEEGGIAEDARQGQRLQQLLAFKEKYVYKTLPAQIIGTSGVEQSRILSIDKGAKDGVAVDMPVITPSGIVGKIREVFPHTSQVLEITDPTSAAGVILAATRIRGILRGNALGQPQVVSVMPDERIKAGEAVVTSGGDQIFPRGLAVGNVDHIVVDPEHDPLVDVVIRPAANLSQLEEVLVITNMGAEVTPRQKLDMMQSEAAASVEQLKASEVLAERLPSVIDPNAPPEETTDDTSINAAGAVVASPMRPPAALHPDRFSPNTTPSAATLTPGARRAPQSEGILDAARPRATTPSTSSTANNATGNGSTSETAAAAAKKKEPELVPGDGSRPPATTARSAASTAAGTVGTHTPAPAAREAENGVSHGVRSDTAGSRPVATGQTTRSPAPAVNSSEPKTRVIVDGPLPSGQKRPAPPSSTTAPVRPATAEPQRTPNAAPVQHPPAQHKGPVLVPDDGSRPPPTMLQKPKPQPQPQKATPAPQQPQGGR
jgi:rod shape-determining protein MreC